jgi:hypothetical protein
MAVGATVGASVGATVAASVETTVAASAATVGAAVVAGAWRAQADSSRLTSNISGVRI